MADSGPNPSSALVLLGTITTAHGVKGQVKIHSLTENPKDIAAYGPLTDKAGKRRFVLTLSGGKEDNLIASVEGVTDRNEAELLRNTGLYVAKSALPSLREGEYYHTEMKGMQVVREDGSLYGIVSAIVNYGAGDIVEIELHGTHSKELLPFSNLFFPIIDLDTGKLVVHPPEYVEPGKL